MNDVSNVYLDYRKKLYGQSTVYSNRKSTLWLLAYSLNDIFYGYYVCLC